mmetsp:Transcript_17178/g.39606  ORF Transcript_17178/g.39606 Transcript_17178/m.39606 type:complete len:269 (-) Transcript_17178:285-1091(-)|eukprot:CAMPEP_0172609662 /NCGR_PEP_ID=MMETSP1068-20121228/29609_1 /TAXON_ID=35684 /ORGANISM="Pseudopedinella elastica, Strain CCMP716" /LENGTH=268 /DNA_ID=CAMNT_0013413225 /DNA_START=113 /DNA_END=919 /DNA_ORIENTATION=-
MAHEDEQEGLSFLSEKELNDSNLSDVGQYDDGTSIPAQKFGSGTALDELSFVRKSAHPAAVVFHLLFKALALAVYLFAGIFTSNYIFVAVVTILLLAFDFWTVKNVTGRLLVGLRWWNYVKEDGSSEWVFESLEGEALDEINSNDSRVFWVGLYAPVPVWGFLLVVELLKLNLQWLVVVCAALSMNLANIVGYTKCSRDAKQKVAQLFNQGSAGLGVMKAFGKSSAFQSVMSGLMGVAMGAAGGGRQASPSSSARTQEPEDSDIPIQV